MHIALNEYYKKDEGHTLKYPIDFTKQTLKMYQNGMPAEKVYECYKKGLNRECHDV